MNPSWRSCTGGQGGDWPERWERCVGGGGGSWEPEGEKPGQQGFRDPCVHRAGGRARPTPSPLNPAVCAQHGKFHWQFAGRGARQSQAGRGGDPSLAHPHPCGRPRALLQAGTASRPQRNFQSPPGRPGVWSAGGPGRRLPGCEPTCLRGRRWEEGRDPGQGCEGHRRVRPSVVAPGIAPAACARPPWQPRVPESPPTWARRPLALLHFLGTPRAGLARGTRAAAVAHTTTRPAAPGAGAPRTPRGLCRWQGTPSGTCPPGDTPSGQ